jgi:hypothetical protein
MILGEKRNWDRLGASLKRFNKIFEMGLNVAAKEVLKALHRLHS